MNYSEALNYIHSLGNFSLPAQIDRIKAVLEKLSNPQNNFMSIHIAGTNGKGSTAAMLSSVLKTAGYKTAFFTSPYIINFRERIQINGEFISEADLSRLTEKVKSVGIRLTEFEFITAVAFLYFSEQKCDIAVIETGLGGRLDATNTLKNVAVSVITKIGLDHTAILGDTIEKITKEKCGIIKNAPVCTAINQDIRALSVIKKHTDKLFVPNTENLKIEKCDFSGNTFLYCGKKYTTRLLGRYQIYNAVTAIEAIKASGFSVTDEQLLKGLENASLPARMESFMGGRIILDGAHNPDGATALVNELKASEKPITAIIGMMKDKDCREVLKLTLPYFEKVITVKAADMPRAISAQELMELSADLCFNVTAANNYSEALDIALSNNNRVFIFGSLYLASGIRPLLETK